MYVVAILLLHKWLKWSRD